MQGYATLLGRLTLVPLLAAAAFLYGATGDVVPGGGARGGWGARLLAHPALSAPGQYAFAAFVLQDALATWMREKFPALVHGAVASSATLDAMPSYTG